MRTKAGSRRTRACRSDRAEDRTANRREEKTPSLNWTVLINKKQVPVNVLDIPSGTTGVTLNNKLRDGSVLGPGGISLYNKPKGKNNNNLCPAGMAKRKMP